MNPDERGYNGWANWETWNVTLWLFSEEPLYRDMCYYLQSLKAPVSPADAEVYVRGMMPHGTPDFDGEEDYEEVWWHEVAEAMEEHRQELVDDQDQ